FICHITVVPNHIFLNFNDSYFFIFGFSLFVYNLLKNLIFITFFQAFFQSYFGRKRFSTQQWSLGSKNLIGSLQFGNNSITSLFGGNGYQLLISFCCK